MSSPLSTAILATLLSFVAAIAIAATGHDSPRTERSEPAILVPAATPVDLNPCASGACW